MVEKSLSQEIVRLRQALAQDPDTQLFVALAEAYLQSGMENEAISVLSQGIKTNPNLVSARVMLAKLYLKKSIHPEASFSFENDQVNPQGEKAVEDILACLKAQLVVKGNSARPPVANVASSALSFLETEALESRFLNSSKAERCGEAVHSSVSEEAASSAGDLSFSKMEKVYAKRTHIVVQASGGQDKNIATATLARLYLDQGLIREAVTVYKTLLKTDPSDLESQKGLELALSQLGGGGPSGKKAQDALKNKARLARLQAWLDVIQRGKRQ